MSIVTWLFYRMQYVSPEGGMQWIWKKHPESKPLMSLNGAHSLGALYCTVSASGVLSVFSEGMIELRIFISLYM